MPPNGMITIPAGTKPRHCRGMELGGTCTQRLYLTTDPRTGNATAVQCDDAGVHIPGAKEPSVPKVKGTIDLFAGEVAVYDGKGMKHFPRCPDRERIKLDLQERERTDVPARKRA